MSQTPTEYVLLTKYCVNSCSLGSENIGVYSIHETDIVAHCVQHYLVQLAASLNVTIVHEFVLKCHVFTIMLPQKNSLSISEALSTCDDSELLSDDHLSPTQCLNAMLTHVITHT